MSRFEQIKTDFNKSYPRGYDILCSVGNVAFDPNLYKSIEDLLEDGDRLMYAQKQIKRASPSL
ncbi:MAG: hypothetical protein AUK48_05385 [Oscillatoriales cyanobacterium CG2_30_44_21]|nr:MAG: hypothetical protein AUK48_05385 [Oscillatoriales cyanobacterium CG2_30_44_21]